MSQESLSALLDGECSDQELDALLEALDRSPELMGSWSRLHAAREARAGLRVRRLDITAAVMARLDEAPDAPRAKVVELASRRKPLAWRPLAGLAAAASVAAVAVTLGFNFGTVPAAGNGPVETASAPAAALQPVALSAANDAGGNAQIDDDLRNYMIEHSNTLAERGVGGALSYARFAARTADEAYVQPVSMTASGGSR
ncbi:sigma-E factor negative regulatory protein [Solimonas soli]|uniref:sigma-E factor negative regulatory protein n=1 Tax=Solimonas soli TaxID=413479 RepID=UPI0004837541|nr:sigma-E factor negative regulatory protein [Solimonas soli]